MTYDKDYFIRKFEAIPDELWSSQYYGEDGDNHCVMGHCGIRDSFNLNPEALALAALFDRDNKVKWISDSQIVKINDGEHEGYQQDTPKARVLAALRDLP